MSTIDTALLDSLNAGTKPAASRRTDGLGQQDFIQLMVAQLKNQDPTKPQDGQEYLSQLAQFSTLNGIQGLQNSFEKFAASLQSVFALQASNLVGHDVMIQSASGYLGDTGAVEGGIDVDADVNDLTLVVTDARGQEVRRLNLGSHAAGQADFTWDGNDENGARLPPGAYRIHVEGQVNGESKHFDTVVRAAVQSISLDPQQGVVLNLQGLGEYDLGAIREIL
ncbi:MAG: flagellar hook assembly protein FlgD [Gammaproteobacteria bacterium]